MKHFIKISAFAFLLALGGYSCSNYVDGYEISPNDPQQSSPPLLTTVIEVATFSHYTGQFARFASIMAQQGAGVQAQYEDLGKYDIFEGDNVNEWASNYSAINDCNTLIALAGDQNPNYRGIAKVLKAMNLAITTDLWGDIPNRAANQGLTGESGFNPAYDAQEVVYQDIQTLLSEALVDLAASDNILEPGSDDLIFNGDINNWIITAHILKARYENRLSKKDGPGSAARALTNIDNAIAAGLTSAASDCNAIFPGDGNSLNQWYAFEANRAGYYKMAEGFVEFLKTITDPRLPFYVGPDASGGFSGTPLGSLLTTTSYVGDYFASPSSSAPLVTYVEAKFIEAEAAFRAGQLARAASAHNEAIQAHILQVTGAPADAAYITAQASETEGSISLAKIMTHKYVALFTQFEVYNDWRRTGIPALSPNPSGSVPAIPRRLPTPQTERLYNSSMTSPISDITLPVWWDQ